MIRVRIAGHVFGLENKYDFVRIMCKDYICDEEPEEIFALSDAELAVIDTYGRPDISEHYTFHGKISKWLLSHDMLLFHGSCLALDGNGILFTAPSGTGKSTHANLYRERIGDRVVMINDDKPLLQYNRKTNQWTAYGSPWCGKEGIHTNTSAHLRCIVVLRQAPENTIRCLSPQETTAQFLSQALIPGGDLSLRIKVLDLIDHLAQLPVYELGCTISQEAVDLSFAVLTHSTPHEETQ